MTGPSGKMQRIEAWATAFRLFLWLVEFVEWPGGEPKQIDLDVTPEIFASVRKGRMTVPLGTTDLALLAGLPWSKFHRIVGPASWHTDQWCLPVFPSDAIGLAEFEIEATMSRRSLGLEPASV